MYNFFLWLVTRMFEQNVRFQTLDLHATSSCIHDFPMLYPRFIFFFFFCWLAGLLACWLAGLLACWLAGLLACWLVCEDADDISTFFIVTIPSSEILHGSGVAFWTMALIYNKTWDSYHASIGDHPGGIHKRAKYLLCTGDTEVVMHSQHKFTGEPEKITFHDVSSTPYICVCWDSGRANINPCVHRAK